MAAGGDSTDNAKLGSEDSRQALVGSVSLRPDYLAQLHGGQGKLRRGFDLDGVLADERTNAKLATFIFGSPKLEPLHDRFAQWFHARKAPLPDNTDLFSRTYDVIITGRPAKDVGVTTAWLNEHLPLQRYGLDDPAYFDYAHTHNLIMASRLLSPWEASVYKAYVCNAMRLDIYVESDVSQAQMMAKILADRYGAHTRVFCVDEREWTQK